MAFEREQEFTMKRRRRGMEYIGLIAFQGFFAARFLSVVQLVPALFCLGSVGGLAWTLGIQRERRRTQPFESRRRIIAEAFESLILTFILVASGIVALRLQFPAIKYQAYVCLALLAFFIASFLHEMNWQQRVFPALDDMRKNSYVANLSKSIIFPYNPRYLRRVFRSRSKK